MKSYIDAQWQVMRNGCYERGDVAMEAPQAAGNGAAPFRISNRRGAGAFVILCDHASNFIPAEYGTLGLTPAERVSHIAWDPGALAVSQRMADALDAPLIESCVSRLVIDCNRPLDAPDLVPEISERTVVTGNRGLAANERERRIALSHSPYHAAIEELIDERAARGLGGLFIAVHSFTPIYKDVARPWQIGIIHDDDMRLAGPLLDALTAFEEITAGDNEPYSPADRVYYTLERHGRARNLPCVMIEIRNDEIATTHGQRKWADLLIGILSAIKLREDASRLAGSPQGAAEQFGLQK
jgi:predicted N-formylglutamate amidohydrolase